MQIFIFMTCLFCGIISGTVYDVLYIARCILSGTEKENYTVKDKVFIFFCDLFYCLVFAAGFIFVSVMFGFSSLRLYMLIGCALGALLYLKSFHQIVAFFTDKAYNVLKVRRAARKKQREGLKERRREIKNKKKDGKDERKEKPPRGGNNFKRRFAVRNTHRRNNLSGGGARKQKQRAAETAKRN